MQNPLFKIILVLIIGANRPRMVSQQMNVYMLAYTSWFFNTVVDKYTRPLPKSTKAGKAACDVSTVRLSKWLHVFIVQHVFCCFPLFASSFFSSLKKWVGYLDADVFFKEAEEEVIGLAVPHSNEGLHTVGAAADHNVSNSERSPSERN